MTDDPLHLLPNERRPDFGYRHVLPVKTPSADANARIKAVRADLDRRRTPRPEALDRRRTVEVSPLEEVLKLAASNKWGF